MKRERLFTSRGFTLLELTVVLTVLSVASTIGMTGLFRMTAYWNELQANMRLNGLATRVFASMADDFDHAVSTQVCDAEFQGRRNEAKEQIHLWRIAFEDDQLAFPVEILNPVTGQRNRLIVHYAIERNAGASRLTRSVSAPDADSAARTRKQVIAPDVVGMRIQYFDGMEWRESWYEPEPPRLVRVSVSVMDSSRPDRQLARTASFPIRVSHK